MTQMTDEEKEKQHSENIRTEYAAISAKLTQLPSFRFALAGLYLAAVGVIASMKQPGDQMMNVEYAKPHFILLIGLTLVLWSLDLRTRQLLANISSRGEQIERDCWGYDGWNSRMKKELDKDTVRLFSRETKLPRFVRHSFGFDLMFLVVLVNRVTRFNC